MATNVINVNVTGSVANGVTESFSPGAVKIDQDAIGMHGTLVSVGFAAEEDMPVGDVTVMGWLFLLNIDETNYVTWGPKSGTMVACGRLEPGEPACLRVEPGVTIRWQADTADVQVKMLLLED